MLDVVNQELIGKGEDPIAFDHDCREGICGMCGFMINGSAHGPHRGTTVCQLQLVGEGTAQAAVQSHHRSCRQSSCLTCAVDRSVPLVLLLLVIQAAAMVQRQATQRGAVLQLLLLRVDHSSQYAGRRRRCRCRCRCR